MHRTVVVLPYRNTTDDSRRAQLVELTKVLGDAGLDYVVVEQSRGNRFNRGLLLNVGHLVAKQLYGANDLFLVFHDIDLLPTQEVLALYKQTLPGLQCLYTPHRYTDDDNFFGGVGSISSRSQEIAGGFPNLFSGWGGEDQEWGRRIRQKGIPIERPCRGRILHTDMERLDLGMKMNKLRHEGAKCPFKRELLQAYKDGSIQDGINDVKKLCSWQIVKPNRVFVKTDFEIFSKCPTSETSVKCWARFALMDPDRRKLEMQNRLRKKLNKPEITPEQQKLSKVMANPGQYLKQLNPSAIQSAIESVDQEPPETKTRKRNKRKKRKNSASKKAEGAGDDGTTVVAGATGGLPEATELLEPKDPSTGPTELPPPSVDF